MLFLTADKSLERKLKEAVLALELERRYSKDRIIEMYLNQVYFGHGAYGVEAAARTYFGKSVSELTAREAALLAGLPRAPSNYSPFDHANAAKRRRELVLRRMVEYGALREEDAKRIARTDLGLIAPERRRTTGQYFLDYVQQTLEAKYGADLVFKGGLNIYTTLSPSMQLAAEQAMRDGLKALEGRSAKARPGENPEGAIITIEPQTGLLLQNYIENKSRYLGIANYNEQGFKEHLTPGCPLELVRRGLTLIDELGMNRADAERWRQQLYEEIRREEVNGS